MMRILGIDFGEKRIGLAISDEGGRIAHGLGVVKVTDRVVEEIGEIISSNGVKEVVIGLPKDMNGDLGEQGKRVSSFGERLAFSLGVRVRLWDERLTTSSSERILIEANLSRKKRRDVVDKVSATIILQGYLDYLNRHPSPPDCERCK